jgi:hypothetical protein
MSDGEPTIFEAWAIVEIFGHQRYAGRVTEENLFGSKLCRIDVPATNGFQAFTKFFGHASIFSLTVVAEDVARKAAEAMGSRPLDVVHYPHELQRSLGYEDF